MTEHSNTGGNVASVVCGTVGRRSFSLDHCHFVSLEPELRRIHSLTSWRNTMLAKSLCAALALVIASLPDTKHYFGFDIRIRSQQELRLPDTFSGPLLANGLLSRADHLFVDEIRGPESFALWKDKVYSSLSDGRIVQVLPDRLVTVALLDPNQLGADQCAQPHNAGQCGRPLGLKFNSFGVLYTVDPYNGLYSVNVTTGHISLVVTVDQLGARFLDDLAVLDKGNGHSVVYMTDASAEWDLYDVAYVVAEHDRSGRLLSYDTETQQVTVELDHLAFPNGLELTDDRSALLMCGFNNRMIFKYFISGERRGQLTTLIDNLPGEPDNIKRSRDSSRETYWVAVFTARNKHRPHITLDTMTDWGYLKRFWMRLQRLVGFAIEQFGRGMRSDTITAFGFNLKTGHTMNLGSCFYGMAIEIDVQGNIVNSMHSPDGVTCALSDVFEAKHTATERHFYLGSFVNSYMGKLVVAKSDFASSSPLLPTTDKADLGQQRLQWQTLSECNSTSERQKCPSRPNHDEL